MTVSAKAFINRVVAANFHFPPEATSSSSVLSALTCRSDVSKRMSVSQRRLGVALGRRLDDWRQ
jgi:hypothetical protein